mgnify:FL=1
MKYLITLIAITTLSCGSSVSNINNKNTDTQIQKIAKDISIEEYKNLINDTAIILDVRRKIEYDAGHLKNAVNIDWFDDNFTQQVDKLDKNKVLLIHCASGGRSSSAMKKLASLGFNTMYNMLGGFNAWKNAGYDYEK